MSSTVATTEQVALSALIDELFLTAPTGQERVGEFVGAQFDLGLSRVDFAIGCGGLGIAPRWQSIVDAEIAARGGPRLSSLHIVNGLAAAAIHGHGTDSQKARLLRPLFAGEHIWCQLFSEPSAGSDLAALGTRAHLDGTRWIVNGQKVWTSMAAMASWGLLLARTDPDASKHAGLTCFALDMTAPGVDVRPLRQLTGEAEFNEVFLTDVPVDRSCQIGGLGDGWAVANTALGSERATLGARSSGRQPIDQAIDRYRARSTRGQASSVERDRLARLVIEHRVIRHLRRRLPHLPQAAGASLVKLAWAGHNQRVHEFCVDMAGADGMLFDHHADPRPEPELSRGFLRSQANTIEGGTTQVHRTLIGERALGLAPEVRLDKGVPWRTIPR